MKCFWVLVTSILLVTSFAIAKNQPLPPVAQITPFISTTHGDVRQDNYHWLRDDSRKNKAVMAYLNAENHYAKLETERWAPLNHDLYEEMRKRQSQDDYVPPYRKNNYSYKIHFAGHANYPLLMRQPENSTQWETVLDARERSKGHPYYSFSQYTVSEDNRYLAIAEDTRGDGQYQISVLDMARHRWLPHTLSHTSGEVVFSQDSRSLFYVLNQPQTLTPNRVMQHTLSGNAPDKQIWLEQDDSLYTGIARSSSGEYLIITLSGNDTSEARVLSLTSSDAELLLVRQRIKGHEYYIDHLNHQFYIRSNRWDKNFGIYIAHHAQDEWQPLVAPQRDSEIENFFLFDRWLVVARRSGGQTQFSRLTLATGEWQTLNFPDSSYMARPGDQSDPHRGIFNYIYSSLNKPLGYYQWDLQHNQQTLLHQRAIADVDLSRYHSEFINITSRDGQQIPVSLVYRRDLFKPGENPLLVYGYGAYGISLDVAFSAPRLSLLDRGFVFALVHVRGGGEKGVNWYLDGKKSHKQNSFNDFIDAAQGLLKQRYGAPHRLYGMGGSAGGLLLAAVVNQAPQLFQAVVLQVPFVDVLNSMLDSSLPLTQSEFDEWGNPQDPAFYRLIKSYSPYENLRAQPYPNMLVTSGLYDSRVPFWQAARYMARLRSLNTNPHALLLLSTNLQAGHNGHAGRYSRLEESVQAFGFLIHIDNKNSYAPGGSP